MSRPNLEYSVVDSDDTFKEFVDFAKTFDHDEGDHTILPVFTIRKDGDMIAYYKIISHPVICPAFHPDKVTARDFHDIVSQVGAWARINSISQRFPSGTSFIAVANKPAIPVSIIEGLGYENLGVQIWQSGGKK